MNLDFFDCNVFIGRPAKARFRHVDTAEALVGELSGAAVGRALVWHIAQHDYSPAEGNLLLSEAITGQGRLVGCWSILPPQTGEVIVPGLFEKMKESGVAALRAFPDRNRFILSRAVFWSFFDEM